VTDQPTPIDVIEIKNWISNLSELTWTFFNELTNQGFQRKEALVLTTTWLAEMTRASKGDA
jgi:hypothetical protein